MVPYPAEIERWIRPQQVTLFLQVECTYFRATLPDRIRAASYLAALLYGEALLGMAGKQYILTCAVMRAEIGTRKILVNWYLWQSSRF